MSSYFVGTKSYGPFALDVDDYSGYFSYIEQWINIGTSHTVRCKAGSAVSFSFTTGLSSSESTESKTVLEGSFGPSAVAAIKRGIENSVHVKTELTRSTTKANSFNFPAPGCGSTTYSISQCIRDYTIVLQKKGLLAILGLRRSSHFTAREWIDNFDVRVSSDPNDPACPCRDEPGYQEKEDRGEVTVVTMDKVTIRTDARRDRSGKAAFEIGRHSYAVDLPEGSEETVELNINEMDDIFLLLSGVDKLPYVANVKLEKVFAPSDLEVTSLVPIGASGG